MAFDVVMPFYGDVDLFKIAVESVLNQDDADWRLVILDDQYPSDEPARWIAGLGDNRIDYRRNEENLGVSGNFNLAIDSATASHCSIIGCDDELLPNYVRRMKMLIELFPDVEYFQPGVDVINAQGSIVHPLADRLKSYYRPRANSPIVLSGQDLARSISRGNWLYFPSLCWRTSTLRSHRFRDDLEVTQDLALHLELANEEASLVYDSVTSFRYRRHSASVSAWRAADGSRFQEEKLVLDSAAMAFEAKGWRRATWAARLRISSRLNAMTNLPSALRARDRKGSTALLKHAFAW